MCFFTGSAFAAVVGSIAGGAAATAASPVAAAADVPFAALTAATARSVADAPDDATFFAPPFAHVRLCARDPAGVPLVVTRLPFVTFVDTFPLEETLMAVGPAVTLDDVGRVPCLVPTAACPLLRDTAALAGSMPIVRVNGTLV